MLERTISLSWKNIANLEIITFSELLAINQHLPEIYPNQQLLEIPQTHPFKIL